MIKSIENTCVKVKTEKEWDMLVKYITDNGDNKGDLSKCWYSYEKESCIWVDDIESLSYGNTKYAIEHNTKIITIKQFMSSKFPKQKIIKQIPPKFILQYEIDEDPFELFNTLNEVKNRIKELMADGGHSYKVYEIKKMWTPVVEKRKLLLLKDYNYMKELFGAFALGLLIFTVSLIVISVPVLFMDSKVCISTYSDYKPKWSILGGCKIDYNGKLTPVGMIKNINLK